MEGQLVLVGSPLMVKIAEEGVLNIGYQEFVWERQVSMVLQADTWSQGL